MAILVLRSAVIALALAAVALGQSPPKRIYIAPDDHTDYYWSADDETYRQAFIEMIDYYLDLADKTEANPPEFQSRWNCDGSFWVWTYEKNKTKAEFDRLIRRVRDGHISFPLNTLVSTYGGRPLEGVLREMYYPGRLERRFGIRVPIAIAMENQTLPYGLGALWAGSGAKYSWKGICGCDTRTLMTEKNPVRRPHEVYWWRGPDGSRILMKWNTLLGSNKLLGGYAEAFDPKASLAQVESEPFLSSYPYQVVGLFGMGWDNLKTLTDDLVGFAQRNTTPGQKLIVSNQLDFFEDMEKSYGSDLPEFSASFGNEWDLYPASVPELLARVRRSIEGLRPAEALATLVSLKRPEFLRGRETARDEAFESLGLFFEHDWTADSPVLQRSARAAWGRRVAGRIEDYTDSLFHDARYALGSLIRKRGSATRFFVFNPLSWNRTDIADLSYDGPDQVHVIELESGREVPSQIMALNQHDYIKGRQFLRILAADVPAAGYRVYEVRPGAGEGLSGGPMADGSTLENEIYRLRLNSAGTIISLVDKSRGEFDFARRLNELGTGAGELGDGPSKVEVENAGPVSVTLKAVAAAPVEHTTRVTLIRGSRRVGIQNEITQNFSDVQTWRFHFNLKSPDVWHEEVGAIARAKLVADGGNYWPTNSRLDWLTLNHFADMSGEGGVGVTLSNADCAFMKLGNSSIENGLTTLDTSTPRISVLAGGQVDRNLGIPAQGGDTYFLQRFALQTHDTFDAAAAMRFALEHQNPLVAGIVTGGGDYPETVYSLLKISNPNVFLWALKPGEEGIESGVIARVWNLSGSPQNFSLTLESGLQGAMRATHIETNIGPAEISGGALSASLSPWQLATYRLILSH